MKLQGDIFPVNELTKNDERVMFSLMEEYYSKINWENFKKDLHEKKWVVLLKNQKEEIKGFSTLMLFDINNDGHSIKVVFSGDTIIHSDYWGTLELPMVWGKFVLIDLPEKFPGNRFYWILISKGYKTYRLLPTHFKTFYPSYKRKIPKFEKRVMNKVLGKKYPDRYDSKTGIIFSNGQSDYLKNGVADISSEHLNNPHIAYFAMMNSGYSKGDELACIAEANIDNLKPYTQRLLTKGL